VPPAVPFLGEFLALLSALFWALAVILFRKSGETVHPLGLNLFKNLVALLFFIPTLILLNRPLIPPLPATHYWLLFFSGLLGMAVGDTLFFMSLNRVGAGISAIIGYMYSPLLITLSLLFLRESLTLVQLLGAILILGALILTTRLTTEKSITRKNLITGILLGMLSTTATAVGVVIIKPILNQTPLLWATAFRLFAGLCGVLIFILLLPERKEIIGSAFRIKGMKYSLAGTLLGTYIALTVWLGGMKFAKVSVAAPLNQLSNVFIFILSALILKEPVTIRRLTAIISAFAGAVLLVFG
jgi:drug/metabolite transporter (DMT)-like permease